MRYNSLFAAKQKISVEYKQHALTIQSVFSEDNGHTVAKYGSKRYSKTNWKKLQIIQNKNLKINYKLSSLLHSKFNLLNTVVKKLTARFEDRNRSSNSEILRNW